MNHFGARAWLIPVHWSVNFDLSVFGYLGYVGRLSVWPSVLAKVGSVGVGAGDGGRVSRLPAKWRVQWRARPRCRNAARVVAILVKGRAESCAESRMDQVARPRTAP